MFWGLVLEPGKRYSTTVDKSFHVSMAALDCSSVKSDSEVLSVILECDGQENILCNLSKQHKLLQSHLDLNFMTGDKVAFEIKGNGIVHLSGYLVPEDDDDDDEYMNIPDYDEDVEDEEEESEESPKKNDKSKQKGKRKDPPQLNEHKGKKLKVSEDSDEDSDEDDEDDEDEEESIGGAAAVGSSDEDEDEEDDDSDEEEDDDSDEDEEMADSDEEEEEAPVQSKKQKTPQSVNKKQQQTPNKQTPGNKQQQQSANKQNSAPLVNGSGPNQQLSNKKNKKKGQDSPKTPIQNDVKTKNQKTPVNEASGSPQQKKKLEGGVFVKEIKEGNGPVAKNGQMVSVFYQGRLKSNNKMFDECKRGGPPFKFRLGKGEVIKGWDIGVSGMKVGGIRSITCPANMAYGQKGSPPQIPPNSALVFQVELKAVN